MNENQFWMVYIKGYGVHCAECDNFNDARLEAEQLMALPSYRGRKVYILAATCYGVSHPSVVWQNCNAATEEEK